MRYIAYFGKGAIVTDDYDEDEVRAGKLYKNIKDDLVQHNLSHCRLYDENLKFVRTIRV